MSSAGTVVIAWGNASGECGKNGGFPPVHSLWGTGRVPVMSFGGGFPQPVGWVVAGLPQSLFRLSMANQHEKTPFKGALR